MALLTLEQRAILHTDILAHPENNGLDDIQLAAYYNTPDPEGYIVWKTRVYQDDITQDEGFTWSRVDNLSVGKARVWEWMFSNSQKSINASKQNIRGGIDTVWVGTAADLLVRAAVYVHCKRTATRLEKLFAIGTGTTASPGMLEVEGNITYAEISGAR